MKSRPIRNFIMVVAVHLVFSGISKAQDKIKEIQERIGSKDMVNLPLEFEDPHTKIGAICEDESRLSMLSPQITGIGPGQIKILKSEQETYYVDRSSQAMVYLRKATGNLVVNRMASNETYEAYFHIPIPFQEQVPILIEVQSSQLIDYRFLHLNPPNIIVAARMKSAPHAELNWTAWILVKANTYSDLPVSVPIPSPEELPESVKKWLMSTDCSQLSAPIVQGEASLCRRTTEDLMVLTDEICSYCYKIPWQFPHDPMAFDAVYTLTWGNS